MVESATHLNKLGLREQPFAPTADPSYFYASADHKSCLHRLWGTIDERHGIAVVLGNYGTGKTTLLRKLMTGMAADPEKYNTAIIGSPIPSWTSFALFEAIISQFGLTPAKRSFVSYMECLNKYLLDNRQWISTLIIDDAQNLNKRGQLELLRLAQNLETPQHKLLNLLLFAQLEWTPILQAAPNFTQRINMIYTLEPLQFGEVKRFIQFRVARARGGVEGAPLYEDAAIEMIHAYAEGNPRVIVTLCRNALLFAAQTGKESVSQDIVLHTIEKTTVPDPERTARACVAVEAGVAKQRPAAAAAPAASPPPSPTPLPTALDLPAAAPRKAHSKDDEANQMLLNVVRAKRKG
jgi:general secretion pathway protein A